MIFVSLIYVFIHLSLVCTIWLWMNFPPYGIIIIYPFGIPLANVLILFSSSLPLQALLLWIKRGLKSRIIENLGQLVCSTGLFLWFQLKEYNFACFGISDSMYGTTF
jgi:heme/copper-type cytochrome/quinol oxidase subunit 3